MSTSPPRPEPVDPAASSHQDRPPTAAYTSRSHTRVAGVAQALAASRRDAWLTLLALLLLLWWEASGLDLSLTRWAGTPQGFPWRNSWLASELLHDGGRLLGWALLALLTLDAAWPLAAGPTRAQRLRCLGFVLAALVCVPLLKRFSATSCPWDLAEFGGLVAYVPHWLVGVSDGGPGHCFPSGHAVAAFAFFPVYFLWRHHRPYLARTVLAVVLGLGIAYGWAQWVRGAHFVSHTLWSAGLCWLMAVAAARRWPSLPGVVGLHKPARPADREPSAKGNRAA